MKKATKAKGLKAHLLLEKDGINFLGQTRMALLEEISRTGSISQAAKVVGISYKGAWDTIDTLNNLSEKPLVEKSAGGKDGGGTKITSYGQEMMKTFRDIEAQYQKNPPRIQDTIKRFSMVTSARNQFTGTITKIIKGAVSAEVILKLDDTIQLTAIVPNSSLLDLDLNKGSIAHALFQSTCAVLSTEKNLKISARNQFLGKVERVEKGAVNSEVTVNLGNRKIVTSTISNVSVLELKLKPGKEVMVLIKSSDVILGVNL